MKAFSSHSFVLNCRRRDQIANFGEKNSQIHLIIIKERPNNITYEKKSFHLSNGLKRIDIKNLFSWLVLFIEFMGPAKCTVVGCYISTKKLKKWCFKKNLRLYLLPTLETFWISKYFKKRGDKRKLDRTVKK